MRRRRSNAGIFQRLLEGGSRTTYHGKIRDRKGKRTAKVRQGKQSVYKGVRIIPVGNGEFETSLDSSRFESKRDAKRFVDSWRKQGNPFRALGRTAYEGLSSRRYKRLGKFETKAEAEAAAAAYRQTHPTAKTKVSEYGKRNPRGSKGDFSRCVKTVSQRKGAKDPEAICAAQERKRGLLNPELQYASGRSKAEAERIAGKMRRDDAKLRKMGGSGNFDSVTVRKTFEGPGRSEYGVFVQKNPAEAAMAVSEEFHGRKVKAMIPVSQKRHYHKYLAELGELRKLEVLARDGKHRVTLSKFDGAMLCTNEDKNQLFLVGGDQGVDLRDFGIKDAHETETLGEVTKIEYFTDKEHLGSEGGEAVYVHKFRTTNGGRGHKTVRLARNPDLIYYLRDEHLEFSGGSYFIRAEGIDL